MMDFSQFDEQVDLDALNESIKEAEENGGTGNFPDIEVGEYRGKIENLEVGTTRDGRPMLKVMFRITEGDNKKCCLFMNRVLYGTKNDGNMIASAIGWLKSLEPSEDVGDIVFESYSQFAELVLDIADDISELEYDVYYDPDEFNSIHIEAFYE